MSDYQAPLKDIMFTLRHVIDLEGLCNHKSYDSLDVETIEQILGEAGKLAAEVMAPLNRTGDQEGSQLVNGVVRTPTGFKDAYRAYVDGGWNAVPFDPEFGGTGLPQVVSTVCHEFWNSANMGFALCPLLTMGAVDAIHEHGSDEQKKIYLEKLISGNWTGTMNLTESQAGSDVGALRTKAEPAADGSWRISGQKIFISYGDHDLTENIIHLVLARTPDGPQGTGGISLFIVPKFLINEDGSLGQHNDVRAVSLEEKCGIHASPTAVLAFGDDGGAVGYLLGAENKGMRGMFTMMNGARLAVGVQGVAIAERAFQQAYSYARERKQGQAIGAKTEGSSPIIDHADVRRMLMTMKAQTEAIRAICFATAEALDLAQVHDDAEARYWFAVKGALLTPIAKSWSTDVGCEVASLGMQVHGGMGYIEETGAAQYYRDVRITPIYEGTNGIQAMDLVMRKLSQQGDSVLRRMMAELRALDYDLAQSDDKLAVTRANLTTAIDTLESAWVWLARHLGDAPNATAAGGTPFLKMFGITLGAYYLCKGAVQAQKLIEQGHPDSVYLQNRLSIACFYGEQLLPMAPGYFGAVTAGDESLYAIDADHFMS